MRAVTSSLSISCESRRLKLTSLEKSPNNQTNYDITLEKLNNFWCIKTKYQKSENYTNSDPKFDAENGLLVRQLKRCYRSRQRNVKLLIKMRRGVVSGHTPLAMLGGV